MRSISPILFALVWSVFSLGCSSPGGGGGSSAACESSLDCPPEHDCVVGECLPSEGLDCSDSQPCPKDMSCVGGKCKGVGNNPDAGGPGPVTGTGDTGGTDTGGTTGTDDPFNPPPACTQDADCGDQDPCTDDLCAGTKCVYPLKQVGACQCDDTADCEDDNPCTDEVCSGKLCKYAVSLGEGCCGSDNDCDDGDPKTADTCDVFNCVNESGGCTSAADCEDGDPCSIDTCSAGKCTYSSNPTCCLKNGECDDGDVCTSDSCVDNVCTHVPKQGCCVNDAQCDDASSCTVDKCQGNICSHSPAPGCCSSSAECDDGDQCTADLCSNGNCSNTPIGSCCQKNADCDDGKPCTEDKCQGGNCINSPKIGCCSDPIDCNDNDKCTQDVCVDGACKYNALPAPGCGDCEADVFEPNETFPGKSMGDIEDCDGLTDAPPATIVGANDVDWYRYSIADKVGCDVQPQVEVTGIVPGTQLKACLYYTCKNGDDADIDCKVSGTTKDTSLGDMTHGCCGTVIGATTLKLRIGPSCSFLGLGNESGDADLKVESAGGTACVGYTFKWGDS